MPEKDSERKQRLDEARALFEARTIEIENQMKYLQLLGKRYSDEIAEIKSEIEILQRHLKTLHNEALLGPFPDVKSKLREATKKMLDAQRFYDAISSSQTESQPRDGFNLDELSSMVSELRKIYQQISNQLGSIKHVLDRYNKEENAEKRERLKEELQSKAAIFIETERAFSNLYNKIINFEPTHKLYVEFAKRDVEEKLRKSQINLDTANAQKLSTTKENVDRVKTLVYIGDYLQEYKEGKPISVPRFSSLEDLYDKKTGKVNPENFPQFFTQLTGIDFSVLDFENEVKIDYVRELIVRQQIDKLSPVERSQLQIDLVEEEPSKEEKKKPIISYLSFKDEEEELAADTPKKKLARKVKKAKVDFDRGFDPYLNKNPLYQKRAREVHSILYERLLAKGEIKSLLDLTKITEVESLRPDIPAILKDHVRNKFTEVKHRVQDKILKKLDQTEIGGKIKRRGFRISTSIVNKSRFIKKHKKKARSMGRTLLGYIIRKVIEKSVKGVVETVQTGYKLLKNTNTVARFSEYFRGTSFGQRLQKITTATTDFAKNAYRLPKEFAQGLITKGNLVYKAIKANRFVVAAMDAGYFAKTALKNTPKSFVYGAGISSIALSLGLPGGSLLPVFIGGSVFGNVLETLDDIMHTPRLRVSGGPIGWLQKQGSALYRDPISGAFSREFIKDNPELAAKLLKDGTNVFGTRAARLFGAAKTGLFGAMAAATIAALLGVNPIVAGLASFGVITAGKYALQSRVGLQIRGRLIDSTPGLSKFAALPLSRMIAQIGINQTMARLIADLIDSLRGGKGLGEFFQGNFSWKDKNWLEKFDVINNYLSLYGYLTNPAFLTRFFMGNFLQSRLAPGFMLRAFGPAQYESLGLINLIKMGWGGLSSVTSFSGLISKLGLAIRGGILPAAGIAASTLLGLGIAYLLGIPIAGIGATVGAMVGGIVGMGIGLIITGGTGGLLAPAVLILNTVGTVIGAWIGSLFDKTMDSALKGVFGIIGGISFLFTLIDIFNNRSLGLRRIMTLSVSLALTMPALTGILNLAEQTQVEADPTKEPTAPSPTGTAFYLQDYSDPAKLKLVNNSGKKLNGEEINKLAVIINEKVPKDNMKKFLVISDQNESKVFADDNIIIITLSLKELNPGNKVKELLSEASFS